MQPGTVRRDCGNRLLAIVYLLRKARPRFLWWKESVKCTKRQLCRFARCPLSLSPFSNNFYGASCLLFPFLFPDFNQLLPSSLSILHLVSYCNFTFCNLLLYCNLGVKPADRASWNAVNSASRMPCMPRRFYDHAEKVLLLALEVRYRLPLLSQSRNLSQLGGRCK